MSHNNQFKLKFNELDQICKKMYYPKHQGGFKAMREFAKTLDVRNRNALLNLINARNMNTHDDTDIISFNKEAIEFLQGLIDGANRKYYNGSSNSIDAKIENLRTKNLKTMSFKMNDTLKKYSFLNSSSINSIRSELNNYIELERRASGLEAVKKHYFDFLSAVNLIESRSDVRSARKQKQEAKRQQRNESFARARDRAINEIEGFYAEAISNTTIFNVIKRNKAKKLKESAIQSIYRCSNYDDLDDVVSDYEDLFYDLDSD